jgi:ribose 5-phosphate isomerase B
MRIALGADHAGVALKDAIKRQLDERGISYVDFGTDSTESVDYPDFAHRVGEEVAGGRADRGILFCGSGIGMAIAANKVQGVRAAAVFDADAARLAREHNDANVLSLGERVTSPDQARAIVDAFLITPFSGGRHQRRVDKIGVIEQNNHAGPNAREAPDPPSSPDRR